MEKEEKEFFNSREIETGKLIEEQKKLAKQIVLKDEFDFSNIQLIAGCHSTSFMNEIIVGIVVMNLEMEIIEEKYSIEKAKFPYISGFRAYRELPAIIKTFHKLENSPDLIFINGSGIAHPQSCGLASHFALAANKPVIGITNSILAGEVKNDKIFMNNKNTGYSLVTKEGSKPIFISPGSFISLNSSIEMTKKFLKLPHKFPEPLHIARKYVKKIMEELK